MWIKVFDMGRRREQSKFAAALEFAANRPDVEQYIAGRVRQFLLDLALTGKAVMPDGTVVSAHQVDTVFPVNPAAFVLRKP